MEMQDAKSCHLRSSVQICRAISLQLRHVSTIRKELVNSSNTSSICPDNMVNFGPLAAEIGLPVWGTPAISTGFASWQHYCTSSSSGRQPKCGVEQRASPIFGRATQLCWAISSQLRHISTIGKKTYQAAICPPHVPTMW